MIPIRQNEVLRYMGYKHNVKPEPHVLRQVESCEKKLQEAVRPKNILERFSLERIEPDTLSFCGLTLKSKSLWRNLKGCNAVYLMAATIGIGADRLIHRAEVVKMSDAVIYQAASAEMIESYCDAVQEDLRKKLEKNGEYLRPRFSPGYGDLPLEYQKDFTRILNTPKTVGITLTESLLMMPSKSVTAIIGVTGIPGTCAIHGCESCGKKDCEFRR